MGRPDGPGAVDVVHQAREERVLDKGRFAASGDTGDADEQANRNGDVDAFKVISPRVADGDPALSHLLHSSLRYFTRAVSVTAIIVTYSAYRWARSPFHVK